MATTLVPPFSARIISPSSDGTITRDLYSTDATATNIWKKGQLLKLATGVIVPVLAYSAAANIDGISGTELTAVSDLFIALEDRTTAAVGKVAVRKITPDTIFEAPLLDGGTGPADATEAIIGTGYELWQLITSADWAPDQNGTTYPVVEIVKVQSQTTPVTEPSWMGLTDTDYPVVQFKFLATVCKA